MSLWVRKAQLNPGCYRGGTSTVRCMTWRAVIGLSGSARCDAATLKSRTFPHQERPNPETLHRLIRVDAPDCKHGWEVCGDVENDFQRELWRLHESNWYDKERQREGGMDEYLFLITEATVIYSNNSRKSISILNYPYKNSSRFFP